MPRNGQNNDTQHRSTGLVVTWLRDLFRSLSQDVDVLKKLVGLAVGLGSITISVINLLGIALSGSQTLGQMLSNSRVTPLLAMGVIWLVSAFLKLSIARWVQIGCFFLATIATAAASNPGNVTSALFLLFTAILVFEYRIERPYLDISFAVMTALYVVALSLGYSSYPNPWVLVTIDSLVLVTLFIVIYGLVLARHWTQHRQEAELLETRVRERTADLEKALDERVVMLQEIHHRVKNNLQIIASLLRLETNRLEDNDVARRPMEASIQRIHAMALVHETLYQSEGFRLVELRGYTGELLNAISGAIEASLHYDAQTEESIEVSLDFAIPFGLLLNELVSNAAEHAFGPGEKGTISITLSGRRDVELVVEDNGIGFNHADEAGAGTSLGLTLVHSLVKQLYGEIQLEASSGTRWHVVFSLDQYEASRADSHAIQNETFLL